MKSLLFVILFTVSSSFILGQTYIQSLDTRVPPILDFVNIDGKATSFYEIYLTNFSTNTFKIKKLTAINIGDSSVQFISQNQDFQNRYSRIGSVMNDTTMLLPPGNTAVIYIELSVQNKTNIDITHLITFEIKGKEHLGEITIKAQTTKCLSNAKLILGKPLEGGPWTSVYDPSWENGHRKVIYTTNGKARIPGRYAIDFIKIDRNGKYANGDENIINNWFGYGVHVLAVADGVVSSVREDFSESPTLSEHLKYNADMATGNYISIKIGDNQYAFYEHLKSKSIKVKVGQKVKKGDIIALLGFTGQSTGPHLHFHVADTDSPLGAEGIPFEFEHFKYLGWYENYENFGKTKWTQVNDLNQINRNEQRPIPNAVIEFRPD